MVAPDPGPAQRVVDGEREIGHRPAADRESRRLRPEGPPKRPQLPDAGILRDRPCVIEQERYAEGIVIRRERRYGGLSENVGEVEENPERIQITAG